ncbi:MAG: hypothetical protein A2V21_312120 [Deltaproteobacteria bacterium GWC2_55_46]|nr:MAG: hypothetical protein A2V21_312120 [Deltaproteobacteria bacterium GWC2_55_46]
MTFLGSLVFVALSNQLIRGGWRCRQPPIFYKEALSSGGGIDFSLSYNTGRVFTYMALETQGRGRPFSATITFAVKEVAEKGLHFLAFSELPVRRVLKVPRP